MKPLTTEEIRAVIARGKLKDTLFKALGILCLAFGLLVIVALILDMAIKGADRFTLDFFLNFASRRATQAGILSAWVGSLLVMFVTALAAVPLGVAAGVYLEEYAPRNWMTQVIEINIANLAAVPSIVYGLLALGIFVYQFGFGQSILSAGLTLALLILPIIIVATREAIRAIPAMIREGSMAVGATRWQTCRYHIIPYAMPGILTGVIIGLARAIGETAPIITIGALTFIAFLPPAPLTALPDGGTAGLFDWVMAPFTVMPIQIFNWTSRPDPAFEINAAAAGFVLMAMVLAMNALAIWLRYRMRKNIKW
ncbi:phosphate ABC transporter permease PstA [Propionivibrio dicarboxylicus]|uniref:Phosphate transport system permease protein PstA n=1 Tax=Propionivibrio dicarboxylicus TaxID=83767 RepID=A0A1G8ES76_9RHOO|nr:phosphate ABC transporter permease PstA [Propionivibrio dicarboxylicus]SDH72726.1 phosphate ABC transporter membrane protein 2, PhoT family [Propionivibrio dicarboxylicus]